MSCLPSPSHHHKYIGGIPTTTKWVVYDIVLTSLCTSNNWAQRAKTLQCPRPPQGSMGIASPNAMVVKKNPSQHQLGAAKSNCLKFVVGL